MMMMLNIIIIIGYEVGEGNTYFGTNFSSIFDAHVVRTPAVQKLSFTAIVTPSSGSNFPLSHLFNQIYFFYY